MAGISSYLLSGAHDENPSLNSTEITWHMIGTLHSFGLGSAVRRQFVVRIEKRIDGFSERPDCHIKLFQFDSIIHRPNIESLN
jgi:hypothetical protein